MKKKIGGILVGVVFVGVILFFVYQNSEPRQKIDYAANLDRTAVTVDGVTLPLRNMAFYIAYEEGKVEKQAIAYNPEDTGQYWNAHTNGVFVKKVSQRAALDMAVHDEILSKLAKKENIELEKAEKKAVQEKTEEFWNGLLDEQQKRICVNEKEIGTTVEKIALAEKYQSVLAQREGGTAKDYAFEGKAYETLREEHSVKVNKHVWNLLDFGNVTITHAK